jgi:hypothetical protein
VLSARLQPARNTALAKYVAGIPRGELKLLKYMPADAAIVLATKTGDLGPAIDQLAHALGKAVPTHAEAVQATADSIRGILTGGGEMACALSPRRDGRVLFSGAVSVKDEEAAAALLARLPELMVQLVRPRPEGGMTMDWRVKPNALEYRGAGITEIQIALDFLAMANPRDATMGREVAKLLLGEQGLAYSAVVEGVQLYTVGSGRALEALKAMIDGKDRLPGTETLKEALAGMPEDPFAVGYLSVSSVANWNYDLHRALVPFGAVGIPEGRLADAPPVGFACTVYDSGVLGARVRIGAAAMTSWWDFYRQNQDAAAARAAAAPEPEHEWPAPPPDAR